MDISSVRLKLSAVAKFQPLASGSRNEQEIGFFDLSADIDGCDVVKVLRLEVANFGTGGNTITIDPGTLAVTAGTGASVGVVNDVGNVDPDGEPVNGASWKVVGLRVVSSDDGSTVRLQNGQVDIMAGPGTFGLASVPESGAISANFNLRAAAGALSPETVLELLFIGVKAP